MYSACSAAILRLVSLQYVYSYDITWNLCTGLVWSMVEASLGIICGSVPVMRPILRKIWPSVLFSAPVRAEEMDLERAAMSDTRSTRTGESNPKIGHKTQLSPSTTQSGDYESWSDEEEFFKKMSC